MILLPVPFYIQGKRSANCGPCSVKSIIEYFDIKKPDQSEYSIHSINRILKTTREFGCDENDILLFFKNAGLKHKFIGPIEIENHIQNQRPVFALFRDELHDGHFAVIHGYDDEHFYFQDPWPDFGENFKRKKDLFYDQADVFNNWLVALDSKPF